jgi:hypothetical protein
MDNPIPPANKAALIENLLRVIAASFGGSPLSVLTSSKVATSSVRVTYTIAYQPRAWVERKRPGLSDPLLSRLTERVSFRLSGGIPPVPAVVLLEWPRSFAFFSSPPIAPGSRLSPRPTWERWTKARRVVPPQGAGRVCIRMVNRVVSKA